MANIERIGALAVAALILASCSSGTGQKASGSSTSSAPTTSGTTPPVTTPTVTPSSLLLGGADLSGYSATSDPEATPVPCGSRFGDSSASTSQAAVALATPGSQQTVNETVVIFPSASTAAAVAAAFRTAGPSCAQFDDTSGPTRTYQVRALPAPAVTADDAIAIALASPAHFYDLVLLRSGARLAWISLGQVGNPVDADILATVTTAAAHRLES